MKHQHQDQEREILAGLVERVRPMLAACLSEAVAEGLASLPFAEVRIAASRDQKALVRCLEGPG